MVEQAPCICPVCVLPSVVMDGKVLLIICLALLGTAQGYTLRDLLRERGRNCLTTVVIVQTYSNSLARTFGEKTESRFFKFTVAKLFNLELAESE